MFTTFCFLLVFHTSGCITFRTGELSVTPINAKSEPGTNKTFTCESPEKVSAFKWTIKACDANSTLQVMKKMGKSSRITLTNAGTAPMLGGCYTIQCTADNKKPAGSIFYVGYPPQTPKLECAMQNLDTLHCRWNHCDPRVKDRMQWQHHHEYTVKFSTTHYNEGDNKNGACEVSSTTRDLCFSSCSSEKSVTGWRYWRKMKIVANVSSKMGKNFSELTFTPNLNVVPSSPSLRIDTISNGSDGEAISIVGNSLNYLKYCTAAFEFKILYKKVSADFTMNSFKAYTEKDYWNDWNQGNAIFSIEKPDLMIDSKIVVKTGKEAILHSLPGNSVIFIEAKWKLNGALCNGHWSTGSYTIYRTKNLNPPQFHQTALLFFDKNATPLPSFFKCGNLTASSVVLWTHTDQANFIHKNTTFEYQVIASNGRYSRIRTAAKSSSFMLLDLSDTGGSYRINLSAHNELGLSSSPVFAPEPEREYCIMQVVSIKLVSLLKFRVKWLYFSRNLSGVCDEKTLKEKLRVGVFLWIKNCSRCNGNTKKRSPDALPHGAVERNFTIDVKIRASSQSGQRRAVDFQVMAFNDSLTFSFHFEMHTAYKIAVSLSQRNGGMVYQSTARVNSNLFYRNVARPTGVPMELHFSDVGKYSMKLTWRHLRLQKRNGPILGYVIYYTTSKKGFPGHDAVTCRTDYGASKSCKENSGNTILRRMIVNGTKSPNGTTGWHFAADDKRGSLSIHLTELRRGTNYYIRVAGYNAAGRSKCFRHVIQSTRNYMVDEIAPVCIFTLVTCCLCGFCLVLCGRRSSCWISIPRPVIVISSKLENSSDDMQCVDVETVHSMHAVEMYQHLERKEPPINVFTRPCSDVLLHSQPSQHVSDIHRSDESVNVQHDDNSLHAKNTSDIKLKHDQGSDFSDCSTSFFGSNSDRAADSCDENATYTSIETSLTIGSERHLLVEAAYN